MKFKLLLILFLSNSICYCQKYDTIRGRIVNEKGSGIAFANIVAEKKYYGTAADSNGNYKLIIRNPESFSDLIIISSIGYNDTIVLCGKLLIDNKIILKENPITLQEIVINTSKKRKIQTLGAKTYSVIDVGCTGLYPGIQWGLYIKNKFNKPIQIKKVEFYITKNGKPNTPVRLRIYNFDTNTKLPGTDLLTKSFINSSKNGGEWLVFDLEKE
ncbi:MAG: carboxypeptidase-like regulatory domain-containing protein, partial [Sphingobacteriales bacterium]|nr:carboxypeptidase-like regulatory domain-containing protein [Sphingobacteriales bacterium]